MYFFSIPPHRIKQNCCSFITKTLKKNKNEKTGETKNGIVLKMQHEEVTMQSKKVYYHRAGSAFSSTLFASQLMQLTEQYFSSKPDIPIFFLCIGSDRVLGDSLGPIIGYKLEKMLLQSISSIWNAFSASSTQSTSVQLYFVFPLFTVLHLPLQLTLLLEKKNPLAASH